DSTSPARVNPRGHLQKRAVGLQPLCLRVRFASSTRHPHIYTNDGRKLTRRLSRESSQRTATEIDQQPAAPKAEPVSVRRVRSSQEERGHSLGRTGMKADSKQTWLTRQLGAATVPTCAIAS